MVYVSIHTLPGSAEELLQRKQAHFDPVVERVAPAYGALFSITAPTSDGLLIVNVWENPERVAAFAALPEMQAAQAAAQLPPPNSFQRYPGAILDVLSEQASRVSIRAATDS